MRHDLAAPQRSKGFLGQANVVDVSRAGCAWDVTSAIADKAVSDPIPVRCRAFSSEVCQVAGRTDHSRVGLFAGVDGNL